MLRFTAIILAICLLCACAPHSMPAGNTANGELIFQSGFENDCRVVARNSNADIVGADKTLPGHNDWVANLDDHPNIGSFSIQFGTGDSTKRFAKIIEEPGHPDNHVLQFRLSSPTVNEGNGRIQGNIYGNNGLKEFCQREKIFLHENFKTVRTYPKAIHWLTIAEFWNNITWSQTVPYRFRITLGLGKLSEKEEDLHFILDAEDCQLFPDGKQKYTTVWAESNRAVSIPIGEWFTMEYYFREGNRENGRFYMAITQRHKRKQVIFDVHNITHNTADPAPDGVGDFNPFKLYTSKELIEFMTSRQKHLEIYFDDVKLWKNMKPD